MENKGQNRGKQRHEKKILIKRLRDGKDAIINVNKKNETDICKDIHGICSKKYGVLYFSKTTKTVPIDNNV